MATSLAPRPRACWGRRVLWLWLVFICQGCALVRKPAPAAPKLKHGDAAALISTSELSTAGFLVRLRVRGESLGRAVAFDCEVRFERGVLSVLGITEDDPRAFFVEQRAEAVTVEASGRKALPIDPKQMLYDVHRSFFYRLPPPQPDGLYELIEQGEAMRERWREGHVVMRRFHALETFAKLAEVRFAGAPAPVVSPRMRIANLHYGYTLELLALEQRHLEGDYSLGVQSARAGAP